MKAKIRTREKCPKGCPFVFKEDKGFYCPIHETYARRHFLYFRWKGGEYPIYHDGDGQWLDSYKRAQLLQASIEVEIAREEAGGPAFNPRRFLKADQQKFWITNLIEEFKKEKTYRPSCAKDYRRYFKTAQVFFGPKDARKLENKDLVDYVKFITAKGLSPKTVKNYFDAVRTFLIWCRQDRRIKMEEMTKFPKIRPVRKRRPWIDQEDQLNLLEGVDLEDRPIILFSLLHPTRPGETRAIRLDDVNLKQHSIFINGTFSKNTYVDGRKGHDIGSDPYEVPIRDEMYDWIARRCEEALPGAWLFANPRTGGPYTQEALGTIWRKLRKRMNLPSSFRLYDASRHSIASQLRAAGVGIEDVKEHLGQKDIRTTMIYAGPTVQKLRANLEKLRIGRVYDFATGKVIDQPAQEKVRPSRDQTVPRSRKKQ